MNRLLLFFCLFLFSHQSFCQNGFLFVKKGAKKKQTYTEGDRIMLRLNDGSIVTGLITLLKNDTIFLTGTPIPRVWIKEVLLPKKKNKFPADGKTLLLITGGAALTTVGLTLNDREPWNRALLAGVVIGYGPLIVKYLGKGVLLALKRKKYRVGRKYRLQVLDFHIPRQRAF